MFRGRERGLDPAMTHRWSWITTAATGLMFKLQALQSVVNQIQATQLAKLSLYFQATRSDFEPLRLGQLY